MTTEPAQLPPCPFCAACAEHYDEFICCSNSGCKLSTTYFLPDAWNRRALNAPIPERAFICSFHDEGGVYLGDIAASVLRNGNVPDKMPDDWQDSFSQLQSVLPPEPEVWELANGKYVIPVIAYDTLRDYAIKVRAERDDEIKPLISRLHLAEIERDAAIKYLEEISVSAGLPTENVAIASCHVIAHQVANIKDNAVRFYEQAERAHQEEKLARVHAGKAERELSIMRDQRDAAMAVVDMVLESSELRFAAPMKVAARAAKAKVGT